MTTVTVGDEQVRLEPFSGRKAIRVIRTIERIAKGVPEILDKLAEFTRGYEAANATELDRTTARYELGPRPVQVSEPILGPDEKPLRDADGQILVRTVAQLDQDGRPVMGPDPLAHMSEQDWAASGNRLRIPRSPTMGERVAAVFPTALDLAEEQVLELLALLAMSNTDLKRKSRDGSLKDYLVERADDIIDADATELLELAVAAGEMVDEQFNNKLKALGDRVPNAARLLGLNLGSPNPTRTPAPSSSESPPTKPTSSTDSPAPTDGESETSSTEPAGSSSSLSPTG